MLMKEATRVEWVPTTYTLMCLHLQPYLIMEMKTVVCLSAPGYRDAYKLADKFSLLLPGSVASVATPGLRWCVNN